MVNKSKGNKVMFFIGIGFVLVASVLLLGNFMGESTAPTMIGFLGVLFLGASNYRLLDK